MVQRSMHRVLIVRAVGGGADYVDCGAGHDRVQADSSDTVVNCEVVLR